MALDSMMNAAPADGDMDGDIDGMPGSVPESQEGDGGFDYEKIVNLVPTFNEEQLKALGEYVVEMKKVGLEESAKYRERRAKHLELFSGDMQGWTQGQKNIVYVHLPYLMKAVLLFHAKMYRNRFPPTGEICGFYSPLPKNARAVRKRSRHINHYLRKIVKEYLAAHDRGGIQVLLYGSAFSVWWYDPILKRNRFEFTASDDIIVPYTHKSDLPDMSDVPWIIWQKRLHRHELEKLGREKGSDGTPYYVGAAGLYPKGPGKAGEPTSGAGGETKAGTLEATSGRIMGFMPSAQDESKPRVLLEMDCWLSLPGSEDQKPVTVCVDEATHKVLRVNLREREDPRDRARFNMELEQGAAEHDTNMAMHDEAMQAHGQAMDEWNALQQPQPGVDEVTGEQFMHPPVPPEQMPEQPQAPIAPERPPLPKKPRRVPFYRVTHYGCIPNPEGFYNYGIGYLIEGPNITSNEVMSLYTSLMRLNTVPTGLYPKMSGMLRGEFKLKLGEMNEIPINVSEFNGGNMFKFLQYPQPDPNAFKIEERMAAAAQEVTADDIVGGGQGLSGQTAAETEIRTSNAMDNISVIQARQIRSQTNELEVLAHLLYETLDEGGESFADDDPMDPEGPQEYVITREDYADDFDIILSCDPNLASQPQRERNAMKILDSVVNKIPQGTYDPVTTIQLYRMAALQLMDALEARNISSAMSKAPPPPDPQQQAAEAAAAGQGQEGPPPEEAGEQPGGEDPNGQQQQPQPTGPGTPDVATQPLDAIASGASA